MNSNIRKIFYDPLFVFLFTKLVQKSSFIAFTLFGLYIYAFASSLSFFLAFIVYIYVGVFFPPSTLLIYLLGSHKLPCPFICGTLSNRIQRERKRNRVWEVLAIVLCVFICIYVCFTFLNWTLSSAFVWMKMRDHPLAKESRHRCNLISRDHPHVSHSHVIHVRGGLCVLNYIQESLGVAKRFSFSLPDLTFILNSLLCTIPVVVSSWFCVCIQSSKILISFRFPSFTIVSLLIRN